MSESMELPFTEQLRRRTTSDDIVDALREAISQGRFKDGEELNQVTLARSFGVSRVPVREALRQLQAEGLVSSQAHMRTVVTGLSLDRVLEVLDLRAMLETYLLERAATRLSPSDLDELHSLCADMDAVADHQEWLAHNKSFHELLYSRSDADLTRELSRQLAVRVERYLHMRRDSGVQRTEEANAEHRRILAALEKGDVGRARSELEAHIAHTRERVIQLFEAQPAD
jgi:DNA-binding GntR family transcriptional regulator